MLSRFNSTQIDSSAAYALPYHTRATPTVREIDEAELNRVAFLVMQTCQAEAARFRSPFSDDIAQEAAFDVLQKLRDDPVADDAALMRRAGAAVLRARRKIERPEQRRAQRDSTYGLESQDCVSQWEDPTLRAEAYAAERAYKEWTEHMPEDQRVAFELIQLERLSYADAAERLGVTIGALRKRVLRAQEYLKARSDARKHQGE